MGRHAAPELELVAPTKQFNSAVATMSAPDRTQAAPRPLMTSVGGRETEHLMRPDALREEPSDVVKGDLPTARGGLAATPVTDIVESGGDIVCSYMTLCRI